MQFIKKHKSCALQVTFQQCKVSLGHVHCMTVFCPGESLVPNSTVELCTNNLDVVCTWSVISSPNGHCSALVLLLIRCLMGIFHTKIWDFTFRKFENIPNFSKSPHLWWTLILVNAFHLHVLVEHACFGGAYYGANWAHYIHYLLWINDGLCSCDWACLAGIAV